MAFIRDKNRRQRIVRRGMGERLCLGSWRTDIIRELGGEYSSQAGLSKRRSHAVRFGMAEMSSILNQVYLSHRRSLLGTVLKIVHDRQIAEDLTQETYIRAYRAEQTGTIHNLGAFLHQTARNLAIDYQRRQRSRERFEDRHAGEAAAEQVAADIASAEDALIEKERFRRFAEVLETLPERAKKAWKLSQIEGWTYDRIARHLGVSRNTVYNDVKFVMGHCHDVLKQMEKG